MALIDEFMKYQSKETKERSAYAAAARERLGIDFGRLSDVDLAKSIQERACDVSDGMAKHEWDVMFSKIKRDVEDLKGDDLLRVIIDQNWILIQQNELIARLLEGEE